MELSIVLSPRTIMPAPPKPPLLRLNAIVLLASTTSGATSPPPRLAPLPAIVLLTMVEPLPATYTPPASPKVVVKSAAAAQLPVMVLPSMVSVPPTNTAPPAPEYGTACFPTV